MSRKGIALTVVAGIAVAAALVVAGLAGATTKASSHTSAVSGSVSFDGVWTSASGQKQFSDVIKAFNKIYPKVHINYKPNGNNNPTILQTTVAGSFSAQNYITTAVGGPAAIGAIATEPPVDIGGVRMFFIYDPDGTPIELVELPAGVTSTVQLWRPQA